MSLTPESVEQLLNSEDYGDRLRAVNQIRDLDPAIAYPLIQQAVADGNPRVRYAAISQLASLGSHDRDYSLQVLRQALREDPEADVQAAAADAIGALQLTEAFDDMRAMYESSDEWLVQFSIIAALGEMGDTRAFELLQLALQSGNELVFTAAIGSLGELGDERALPLLLGYVDADDWQVRHRLVQALANYHHPDAKAALEKLSQDTAVVVAETAKQHLSA